jgi:hypothetical protein
MTATWTVFYKASPSSPLRKLSLSSPDPHTGHGARRAAGAARARLKRQGIRNPIITALSCNG